MTRYDLRDAVRERRKELAGGAVTVDGEVIESADLPPTKEDLADDARAALEVRLSEMSSRMRPGFEAGFLAGIIWSGVDGAFKSPTGRVTRDDGRHQP